MISNESLGGLWSDSWLITRLSDMLGISCVLTHQMADMSEGGDGFDVPTPQGVVLGRDLYKRWHLHLSVAGIGAAIAPELP